MDHLKAEKQRLEQAIKAKEDEIQTHFSEVKETTLSPVKTVKSFLSGATSRASRAVGNTPKRIALDAGVTFLVNSVIGSRLGPLRPVLLPFLTRKLSDTASRISVQSPVENFLKWVIRVTDDKDNPTRF